jgi:hypothetical protein
MAEPVMKSNPAKPLVMVAGLLVLLGMNARCDEVAAGVAISTQQQNAWVGQQITVNLDLKTTGFRFSNVHFSLPQVSNAFLMQTDTTTIKLSERTAGQTWQILRYPLALYPQQAGGLEIPPITVRFATSAGFGSDEKAFKLQTESLHVEVNLPPGVAENSLVVTTGNFELNHDWYPQTETANTGDAVTLKVTRRAKDISATLLPPLPVYRAEGLAAYPRAPEITDRTSRGDLTGERIDSITWVVEKPGYYRIPGIRFEWWNPDNQTLEQQVVAGRDLDVTSSPADDVMAAAGQRTSQNYGGLLRVAIFAVMVILGGVLWRVLRQGTSNTEADREKFAFDSLQKACRNNQAGRAYMTIHAWLDLFQPAVLPTFRPVTLDVLSRAFNDKKLGSELEQLQQAVISQTTHWRGSGLAESLKRIRREYKKQDLNVASDLPPLNP